MSVALILTPFVYQHLTPAYLAEAVGPLDAVFGEYRYQDVTAPKLLLSLRR